MEWVVEKIINIIWDSYGGLHCKVVDGGQLTDAFEVRIGVILLAIDWIMKTITPEGEHRIQWIRWMQLDDLDFAGDVALLSHTHEQIQANTTSAAAASISVCLKIHEIKCRILKCNTENTETVALGGEILEDVESFTNLGSIIDERGGSDSDIKSKIGKAGIEFLQLKNTWNSKQFSTNTKTTSVAAASAAVSLNIHKGQSKILRYNTTYSNRSTVDGEDLEYVKSFTYLGSIIDEHSGYGADVRARISKARTTYLQLKNIWNSKQLSVK
ncbi:unnamed protein product [Schistosoma margrebowiei]|uniref:Uncharacterized protein n=1 Tax=Schistosoma margrebowiei TaxID=48269 RepID=A0A183LXZ3_9TREM|nr:unnamed protein product [Schistosoma margrebowiei]